jgi:hypothetical protein
MPIVEGKKFTRNCFVCEKSISSALTGKMRQEFSEPTHEATCWTTCGNYGSEVFDPQEHPEELEICICDDCLTHKKRLVYRFVIEKKVVAVGRL